MVAMKPSASPVQPESQPVAGRTPRFTVNLRNLWFLRFSVNWIRL